MTNKLDKLNQLSITPAILASNGYKQFLDTLKDKSSYVESWQKCVRNEHGKAYFINFNFYVLSGLYQNDKQDINPYSWGANLQLDTLEEDMTVNIKVFASHKNLTQVEAFCEKIFKRMQFRNYEYYSDDEENSHKNEIKKQEILESANVLESQLPKKREKQPKRKYNQ